MQDDVSRETLIRAHSDRVREREDNMTIYGRRYYKINTLPLVNDFFELWEDAKYGEDEAWVLTRNGEVVGKTCDDIVTAVREMVDHYSDLTEEDILLLIQ